MALPIKDGKIGTPYGKPGKIWSAGHHQGVDFPCKVGTPVLAAKSGRVVAVGAPWGPNFGHHSVLVVHRVKKTHGIGTKPVWAIYAHCSEAKVKVGQRVKKGQVIALSGKEGNVTGPHLHFEVHTTPYWNTTSDIDPQPLLDC